LLSVFFVRWGFSGSTESNKKLTLSVLRASAVNYYNLKGDLNEGPYRLPPWLFDIKRFIFQCIRS
jgi:hypothetical protein